MLGVSGSQGPTASQYPLQPSSVWLLAWIPSSSPHDSFNKHFPSAHSGSQGLEGKEVDSEYPPPTETGRPVPELSPASISGSPTLRSSIPQPTGQEGLGTGCLAPQKQEQKGLLLLGCGDRAASLLCPQVEGTCPCPVKPRGRREESRNLPPH